MRWMLSVIMTAVMPMLIGAEWLAQGIHEQETTRKGITCTVIVPSAISEGTAMPVLFVLAEDGKPDAKRWQEWGERRGCAVVGINGFRWSTPIGGDGRWITCITEAEAVYTAVLATVKKDVPVHPVLRFLGGAKAAMPLAVAITKQAKEQFGGLLMLSPGIDSMAGDEMRKDVPVVVVMGANNPNGLGIARRLIEHLTDGGTIKLATVDDLDDAEPSIDVSTRCMDWLMNISKATHHSLSTKERKDNLEHIAAQAQELPGLVNPVARRECAGFLMSVPGMDKLRREYERLADVWLDSTLEITKAREEKDVVDAHEYLSVVTKGPRFKEASAKEQRAAMNELTRLRKNPKIKNEMAAFDLVADTCAMLDHDSSLAKQRIALKDLQGVIAQYPMTHAAETAAKLVRQLQQNVRN